MGYNSDQNSHSFWREGKNSSPFVSTGTPCSKYNHVAFNEQMSPCLRQVTPMWENMESEHRNKQDVHSAD